MQGDMHHYCRDVVPALSFSRIVMDVMATAESSLMKPASLAGTTRVS